MCRRRTAGRSRTGWWRDLPFGGAVQLSPLSRRVAPGRWTCLQSRTLINKLQWMSWCAHLFPFGSKHKAWAPSYIPSTSPPSPPSERPLQTLVALLTLAQEGSRDCPQSSHLDGARLGGLMKERCFFPPVGEEPAEVGAQAHAAACCCCLPGISPGWEQLCSQPETHKVSMVGSKPLQDRPAEVLCIDTRLLIIWELSVACQEPRRVLQGRASCAELWLNSPAGRAWDREREY